MDKVYMMPIRWVGGVKWLVQPWGGRLREHEQRRHQHAALDVRPAALGRAPRKCGFAERPRLRHCSIGECGADTLPARGRIGTPSGRCLHEAASLVPALAREIWASVLDCDRAFVDCDLLPVSPTRSDARPGSHRPSSRRERGARTNAAPDSRRPGDGTGRSHGDPRKRRPHQRRSRLPTSGRRSKPWCGQPSRRRRRQHPFRRPTSKRTVQAIVKATVEAVPTPTAVPIATARPVSRLPPVFPVDPDDGRAGGDATAGSAGDQGPERSWRSGPMA